MKRLILFIYMLISFFPTAISTKLTNYLADVSEAYDVYTVTLEEKENYTVAVVQGMCNGTLSYGVYLGSFESGKYTIVVIIEEKQYVLPSDSRKDTYVCAVNMPIKETYVCVYDKEGNSSTKRWEYKLDCVSEDVLRQKENLKYGENKGVEVTTMSRNFNFQTIIIFIVAISLVIIALGVAVIIFFKKNKKGVFSKKHLKETVNTLDENNEDFIEIDVIDEKENEPLKEVYEKKYYFDDDEDNYIDLKPLFEKEGLSMDYKNLSEEEKNNVMIFFMRLRHEGKITEAQYKKETSRLWKKY